MQGLPPIVTLSSETSVSAMYDNHTVTSVNDHVVRISTMTQTFHWHCHPNSDETFLVLEGGIAIEFEQGEIQLAAGQMATVSRGVRHRTRPLGKRSVNLTFEAADTKTELSQPAKDR
jgi:mannose-6-phosphate isomerase-like protein (cupin superfamily)